uniref:Uncharacterized protein n=1 Tax=Solanum lycopersicum TaxID=4081 RepID=A0A3Q7G4P9_SOLLC
MGWKDHFPMPCMDQMKKGGIVFLMVIRVTIKSLSNRRLKRKPLLLARVELSRSRGCLLGCRCMISILSDMVEDTIESPHAYFGKFRDAVQEFRLKMSKMYVLDLLAET